MYIEKSKMKAYEYIKMTRSYLDYLEEHFNNIRKAFQEVTEACNDMWWAIDDCTWHELREDVYYHDISKFSQQEFVPYRANFFSVENEESNDISEAWKHHKCCNTHHHETVKTDVDVIHMIIDWTAMGYKFNDTAQQYYEKNKDKIKLSKNHKELMFEVFDRLKKYNDNKNIMDINEAIKHAEELAKDNAGTQCGKEHAQLAKWLKELAEIKNIPKKLQTLMHGLMKEAHSKSFVEFCYYWNINYETDYEEIKQWFENIGIIINKK